MLITVSCCYLHFTISTCSTWKTKSARALFSKGCFGKYVWLFTREQLTNPRPAFRTPLGEIAKGVEGVSERQMPSHPPNRRCSPNSGNSTYIIWKRSIRVTEPCFPLLTQWDFCPCLLSEQGHPLKVIHPASDKLCGNRETSHNDWSWCWRCLVQTYMAARVPRKLLGSVRDQQPIPGPSVMEEMLQELQAVWQLPVPSAALQLELKWV